MNLDYNIERFFQRSLLLFFLALIHCCGGAVEIITIFLCTNCPSGDYTFPRKGELHAIRV